MNRGYWAVMLGACMSMWAVGWTELAAGYGAAAGLLRIWEAWMSQKKITPGQLRKIWASSREIGLEEEEVRDKTEEVSGGRSISALSFAHAHQLIEVLVKLGATSGSKPKKPRGRTTEPGETLLITGGQRVLISRLREDVGGKWLEDPYFAGVCKKVLGRHRPRTAGEGAKIIEALKKRRAYDRRREAAGGA